MSIGETMTRLGSHSRPIRPGWNIGGHRPAFSAGELPGT
jgi:hypothetical protein